MTVSEPPVPYTLLVKLLAFSWKDATGVAIMEVANVWIHLPQVNSVDSNDEERGAQIRYG